jgi:adenylate cyclase
MISSIRSRLRPRHSALTLRSWILISCATAAYLVLFLSAFPTLGRQAALFAYIYIGVVAWIFGARRALVAALFACLVTGSKFGRAIDPSNFVGILFFFVDAMAVGAVSRLYVKLEETQEKLREEHEKSEMILRNIFPKRIAERLKDGEVMIADRYLQTTLLFSDLVGFTDLTRTMAPHQLVHLLDQLITGFDQLSEELHIEKIKTIGDAYLVVSGMPDENTNHAPDICRMALAMQAFMREFNRQEGLSLRIRIGIHSGSVIGGVIGPKKFTFDLWGDTVNLASRMETTGIADRIQVSESTWELTRHIFRYEPRPAVEIKGYGPVRTYFLLAPLDPWQTAVPPGLLAAGNLSCP